MIKATVLSIVFFIIMLTIPYVADADIIIEPAYDKPQDVWIDPNNNDYVSDTFISKHGLVCKNAVWQVNQNTMSQPARKCRLPDGSWQTFFD